MKKLLLVLISCLMVFVVGCSKNVSTESTPSTIDEVVKKGKLVVGTAPGYFPFEMKDLDGNFVGYDIDVAKAIAESLKVDVEYKQFGFDGLIPALQTGEIDMVIAGMTIRGDRALAVSFSNPYYATGQVLMLPKSDTNTKSWKDLDKPGNKIAVSLGTTGALLAKELFEEAEIIDFETFPDAALAVIQGAANGVIYDEPGVRTYELKNKNSVRGVYNLISVENLGIAVRQNDLKTVQWLNSFIQAYKGSTTEIESFNKWFESNDWMDKVENNN